MTGCPHLFARIRSAALLLLLSLSCLQAADSNPHQMPRNPSSAKECAICHYRWVDTFFIDGRGTDLVPLQTEPVVGTAEMCFSCHDGSVLDSRWAFEKDHGHRTGIPPKPGMQLPPNFPLDAKGNMQCVTCHSAHGVSSTPGESASTFLRVSNTNSAMCLICHPSMAGNSAGENHPLGRVTNAIPRELWTKHTTPEIAAHTITCQTCHTPHANKQDSLLKLSASDGSLCLSCHQDKNPVNPDGTRNFQHAINVLPSTATVPATLMTNGAKLSKTGAVTCLTCHKVHQNKIEKHLLVAKTDNQSTFCFQCHQDKKDFIQTKHNLTQAFPKVKNLAGNTVLDSGPCSACHLPHKNARPVAGGDLAAGQCMGCHGPSGISSNTNLVGRSHPTGVRWPSAKTPAADAKTISLPLFDALRHQTPSGSITCVTCHDPHKAQPSGSASGRPMFLRKPGTQLCKECHASQTGVIDSKHDFNTTAAQRTDGASGPAAGSLADPPHLLLAARNVQGKTPSESGSCGVCHLMHSAGNSTWAQPLPASPNPADKCLGCHRAGGSGEKKKVLAHSHPIDVAPEKSGLKTTLPLYAELSQTNAPGKMTCMTCHDPHRQAPMLASAPGSRSGAAAKNGFLRMPVSPAPSLCADCHPKEALVMGTGHDLTRFLPDSVNRLGVRAAETGPCGACHAAHNAPAKSKLWARDRVQPWLNTPVVDAMCRSCHSPEGIAANKTPALANHPPVAIINQPETQGYDRSFFPLFDPVTGAIVSKGGISCSSCHNVHQWSAATPAPGSGVKTEGDSNNSFLRHKSYDLPCKICHGHDAIYRYQYFHKSSSRQRADDTLMDDLFR